MTSHATAAPPSTTAARRYSESMHVLVTRPVRELLVGLAVLDAAAAGTRPREGEAIRDLLDSAIAELYASDPQKYTRAVRKGRQILRERDARKGPVTK